jgi:hypothetical protein
MGMRAKSLRERHAIIAGLAGNVMEWYDFSVYGYFAASIGRHFFPTSVLLVLMRLLQGLSVGGEYTISAIFLVGLAYRRSSFALPALWRALLDRMSTNVKADDADRDRTLSCRASRVFWKFC